MKFTKSEPHLELACLGISVKAKGSLAVVIVALLITAGMVLRMFHIS